MCGTRIKATQRSATIAIGVWVSVSLLPLRGSLHRNSLVTNIAESASGEARKVKIPDLNEPWSPSSETDIRLLSPDPQPPRQLLNTGQAAFLQTDAAFNLPSYPQAGSKRGREHLGSSVPLRSKLPVTTRRGKQPRPVPEGSTPEAEQALKDYNAAVREQRRGRMTLEEVRDFLDFATSFPFNRMERRVKDTERKRRRRAEKRAAGQAKVPTGEDPRLL